MSKTYRALLISDGIPGHANQAKGLLSWLEDEIDLSVDERVVKLKTKALARPIAKLLLNRSAFSKLVVACYKHDIDLNNKPDFIVSAGGNTSFLNAALAKFWGCPNFFLGSLRGLKPESFSAVLTLEPVIEGVDHPNNIVVDFPPSLVTPEKAAVAAEQYKQQLPELCNAKLWTLVVGGDGAGFEYDKSDWLQLAAQANELAERHDIKWLITTSRRSGVKAEQILKANIKQEYIAEAVWWSEKPKKVMLAYLGLAEKAFVTADSMSMITECFSSGTPAYAIKKGENQANKKYLNALDKLEASYIDQISLGKESVLKQSRNLIAAITTNKLSLVRKILMLLNPK